MLAYSNMFVLILVFAPLCSVCINISDCFELNRAIQVHMMLGYRMHSPCRKCCANKQMKLTRPYLYPKPAIKTFIYPFMVSLDIHSFSQHFSGCECSLSHFELFESFLLNSLIAEGKWVGIYNSEDRDLIHNSEVHWRF